MILFTLLSFFYCTNRTPAKSNKENAAKSRCEKPAAISSPKQAATIHSVKIGTVVHWYPITTISPAKKYTQRKNK